MRQRIRRFTALAVLALTLAPGASLHAQGMEPGELDDLAGEILRQERAAPAAPPLRRAPARDDTGLPLAPPDPFAAPKGGPCFTIRNVVLSGAEALPLRPQGHKGLAGRCVTAADVSAALNQLNLEYQEAGYITTRAYVPEQDLRGGTLRITVQPGRIEGYVYKGGAPADPRLLTAMPAARGELLSLRALEQGLDNLNGPRSASARFALIPGATPGGSFVEVDLQDRRPWSFSALVDNGGLSSTGRDKLSLIYRYDNLLQRNDQLSLSLGTTRLKQGEARHSDSLTTRWGMPHGNWNLDLEAGFSRYAFPYRGAAREVEISGETRRLGVSADYLLSRDQSGKLSAYGGLELHRSRSRYDGIDLSTQNRNLTIASLGLRGERAFPTARLSWSLGLRQGLDALGARVAPGSTVDPAFRLVRLDLSYEHHFSRSWPSLHSELALQYSRSTLPGSEQFNIGGRSSVRGFRDDSLYGDSGAYLRNTLALPFGLLDSVQIEAGLDLGYVRPSGNRFWSRNYIAGASLGARIGLGQGYSLTVEAARALVRPDRDAPGGNAAFRRDRNVLYLGLRSEF